MKTTSQPASGIEGYRQLTNRSYEPHFDAGMPSNWFLSEMPLQSQKGHWISLRGPANESQTRGASLDIYLIERGPEPQYRSLDAYVEFSMRQESFGETQTLLAKKSVLDGVSGEERKISYKRAYPTASGVVEVTVVKQWITVFVGDHILQLIYESPQELFETFFEAYRHVLDTFVFRE